MGGTQPFASAKMPAPPESPESASPRNRCRRRVHRPWRQAQKKIHRGMEGNRIAFHQGPRSRVTPLRERREAESRKGVTRLRFEVSGEYGCPVHREQTEAILSLSRKVRRRWRPERGGSLLSGSARRPSGIAVNTSLSAPGLTSLSNRVPEGLRADPRRRWRPTFPVIRDELQKSPAFAGGAFSGFGGSRSGVVG